MQSSIQTLRNFSLSIPRSYAGRNGSRYFSAKMKPFPSITISPHELSANGSFAETQLAYLSPDKDSITELDSALHKANMGVVSHFYMDPELQGTLTSSSWPHIVISDSLAMGDAAVKMVKDGNVSSIACLGVDFMAESVRSVLDMEGLNHIPVYRLSKKYIGCSLAESAERPAYKAWLEKAKKRENCLHVVYINTSILTKAQSHALVPTIACTSSNVVRTILQAYHQVPNLTVWYGPDTYMGENLRTLFTTLSTMPDETIQALHPEHNQATIKALLTTLEVFPQGNCVVHHMFGSQVADQIEADYADAYLTAHLEVPGEMFKVASDAATFNKGVVGSTSNILDFILSKTSEKLESRLPSINDSINEDGEQSNEPLTFVLGTEAGMVTPIVRKVQRLLQSHDNGHTVKVEIVFPVASEAFTVGEEEAKPLMGGSDMSNHKNDLSIIPGTGGGEGCSAAGGCATCPFMKMNTLDALIDLASFSLTATAEELIEFKPSRREVKINEQSSNVIGTIPIIHMRHLNQNGLLSNDLVNDIQSRHTK